MFVESGLGVRVKFDLNNTVYLTVTAEHMATTRGLCGLYNNNADGERRTKHSTLRLVSTNLNIRYLPLESHVLFSTIFE